TADAGGVSRETLAPPRRDRSVSGVSRETFALWSASASAGCIGGRLPLFHVKHRHATDRRVVFHVKRCLLADAEASEDAVENVLDIDCASHPSNGPGGHTQILRPQLGR